MGSGFDVVSSAEFSTTPGFELATWVVKKSGNGACGGEVTAVVFAPPNKVEVIGNKEQEEAANIIKEVMKDIMGKEDEKPAVVEEKKEPEEEKGEPAKEEGEEKKEEEAPKEEEKKEGEEGGGDQKEGETKEEEKKPPGDDTTEAKDKTPAPPPPSLPYSTFNIDMNKLNGESGNVIKSKLVLDLCKKLFCSQWRLVASSPMVYAGDQEVLFFCKDNRYVRIRVWPLQIR